MLKGFQYILFLFIFLVTKQVFGEDMPYLDEDFECITETAAREFVGDYNIRVASFGGLELCDHNVDTKKLFNDLIIIDGGQFAGTKGNVFIRDFIPATEYGTWLRRMTRSIRRKHDIPHATAYNSFGHFTMQNGWALLSTLGRVGTIIHEARHTEGYRHYPCKHGPYEGARLAGCDRSVESGGSHGVEMEYYSRVFLQGQNFHPVYQSMARLMNLARGNFVFNRLAMMQKETLFALTSQNKGVVVSEGEVVKMINLPSEVHQGILKRSSLGATLFRAGGESWAIDIYNEVSPVQDTYSYYKLLLLGARVEFIDVEEFDEGAKRFFVGVTADGRLFQFNFPKGAWGRQPISLGAQVSLKTQFYESTGLFLVYKDGVVKSYSGSRQRIKQTSDQLWPKDVLQFVKHQGVTYALKVDGKVYNIKTGQVFEALKGHKIFSLVNVPSYDFGYTNSEF